VLSASMDTHGNLSAELATLLDLAACHRHAPHIDHPLTRERAVVNLVRVIEAGVRPVKVRVGIPVLLPGERTSTVVEPARTVFGDLLPAIERHGVLDAALYVGFLWADEPRNCAVAFVTGFDEASARACADELAAAYWGARDDFVIVVEHSGTIDEALDFVDSGAATPVFVSDSGDNVTAGASGDITLALHAVRDRKGFAERHPTLLAGLVDTTALAAAIEAGVGGVLTASVGAGLDARYAPPAAGPWTVRALIPATDGSGRIDGALLDDGRVHVTVQWARDAFVAADDPAFPPGVTSGTAWVDPSAYDLVVVKNGYPFPSQVAAASSSFLALTPGGTDLVTERLDFRSAARPLYPLDTAFDPDLAARVIPPYPATAS
jgi:microcystin degradation protein MlrC